MTDFGPVQGREAQSPNPGADWGNASPRQRSAPKSLWGRLLLFLAPVLIIVVLIIAMLLKCAGAGKSLESCERLPGWKRPKFLCSNAFEMFKHPRAFRDVPRAVPS